MHKVSYENNNIILHFEKELVDEETLARFLSHINFQSMLKTGGSSD